jgi:hypothetical protein
MKQETIYRLKQAGMILFLLMVVIGFTVPVILNSTDQGSLPEQKTCQNDAECYLTCDDLPVKVICLSNLCQQVSCDEQPAFPYSASPTVFSLQVLINNQSVNLQERINPSDLFIASSGINGEDINLFTSGLYLQQVFEKLNILLTPQCLIIGELSYCNENGKELKFYINNEPSYQPEYYIPKVGDKIKIIY